MPGIAGASFILRNYADQSGRWKLEGSQFKAAAFLQAAHDCLLSDAPMVLRLLGGEQQRGLGCLEEICRSSFSTMVGSATCCAA